MRQKFYLNNDWKYNNTFSLEMLKESYDFTSFETVRLPHTVAVTPFNYFDESIYQMVSCYKQTI